MCLHFLHVMGRKSFAQKFFEELEVEDGFDYSWIVLYNFHGVKPNPNFWSNLKRLSEIAGGELTHYSVYRTNSLRGTVVADRLARHYGAETLVYKGEEMDLDGIVGPREGFRIG